MPKPFRFRNYCGTNCTDKNNNCISTSFLHVRQQVYRNLLKMYLRILVVTGKGGQPTALSRSGTFHRTAPPGGVCDSLLGENHQLWNPTARRYAAGNCQRRLDPGFRLDPVGSGIKLSYLDSLGCICFGVHPWLGYKKKGNLFHKKWMLINLEIQSKNKKTRNRKRHKYCSQTPGWCGELWQGPETRGIFNKNSRAGSHHRPALKNLLLFKATW